MRRGTGLLLLLAAGCGGQRLADLEPGEELPGGDGTNTILLGNNAFTLPLANLEGTRRDPFFAGNSFFTQNWVTAPASTTARDGLGPTFNSRSCSGCHFLDGRGRPPLDPEEPMEGLLIRISVPGGGPDPAYGGQIQPNAIPDVPVEARAVVTYESVPGSYEDGEAYELRRPRYDLVDLAFGAADPGLLLSPRVAPQVIGLGLLESIPEARLIALQDPDDADGDGISGRIQRLPDMRIGRLGWKAEQPSVREQTAGALAGDIGITTTLHPDNDCPPPQAACAAAVNGGEPEMPDDLLDALAFYGRTLAVPVRREPGDREVRRGKLLFGEAGCDGCHVPRHETESDEIPELAGQTIWPYTDLLLHDMGEELADGRPVLGADGREWRTPPLWGLGLVPDVNGHDLLLHDGRARGFAEAILWHGGEAEASREAFRAMTAEDRAALLRFLASL